METISFGYGLGAGGSAGRLHRDRDPGGREKRHRQAEEAVEPERARQDGDGTPRKRGIACRVLASHVERPGQRKRSRSYDLPEEADPTAARLDEHQLEVGADAAEDDSRETPTAADVDHQPPSREKRNRSQGVHRMLGDDPPKIAVTNQPQAAVPHRQDSEESSDPRDRVR